MPLPESDAVRVAMVLSPYVRGKVTLPLRAPVAEGVNTTYTEQLPPAGTMVLLQPSEPPAAFVENSPLELAPTAMLTPFKVPTLRARLPLLVRVRVSEGLVVPTTWSRNVAAVGESTAESTTVAPVPARVSGKLAVELLA